MCLCGCICTALLDSSISTKKKAVKTYHTRSCTPLLPVHGDIFLCDTITFIIYFQYILIIIAHLLLSLLVLGLL